MQEEKKKNSTDLLILQSKVSECSFIMSLMLL